MTIEADNLPDVLYILDAHNMHQSLTIQLGVVAPWAKLVVVHIVDELSKCSVNV